MDVIALLSALGAFIAGISGILSAILLNRKTTALLEYRLGEVETHLKTHNHYAEKLGDMTTSIQLIQKDIEYIKDKHN